MKPIYCLLCVNLMGVVHSPCICPGIRPGQPLIEPTRTENFAACKELFAICYYVGTTSCVTLGLPTTSHTCTHLIWTLKKLQNFKKLKTSNSIGFALALWLKYQRFSAWSLHNLVPIHAAHSHTHDERWEAQSDHVAKKHTEQPKVCAQAHQCSYGKDPDSVLDQTVWLPRLMALVRLIYLGFFEHFGPPHLYIFLHISCVCFIFFWI